MWWERGKDWVGDRKKNEKGKKNSTERKKTHRKSESEKHIRMREIHGPRPQVEMKSRQRRIERGPMLSTTLLTAAAMQYWSLSGPKTCCGQKTAIILEAHPFTPLCLPCRGHKGKETPNTCLLTYLLQLNWFIFYLYLGKLKVHLLQKTKEKPGTKSNRSSYLNNKIGHLSGPKTNLMSLFWSATCMFIKAWLS